MAATANTNQDAGSSDSQQRSYPKFQELDAWNSALRIWQLVWQQTSQVSAEDALIKKRSQTAAVGLATSLAKAHGLKYWDADRRQAHLTVAQEMIAELAVCEHLLIELEYTEHTPEFDQELEALAKMTAGMIKSRAQQARSS